MILFQGLRWPLLSLCLSSWFLCLISSLDSVVVSPSLSIFVVGLAVVVVGSFDSHTPIDFFPFSFLQMEEQQALSEAQSPPSGVHPQPLRVQLYEQQSMLYQHFSPRGLQIPYVFHPYNKWFIINDWLNHDSLPIQRQWGLPVKGPVEFYSCLLLIPRLFFT